MYTTTVRQSNFRKRTGSSSIAPSAKGYGPIGDPVEILPTLKEQYEHYKRRAAECTTIIEQRILPTAERERARRELAECIRHEGNLRNLLQDGSRLAFEKILVQVAQYRLPKDKFLAMVDEAREIWRAEGYADVLPPSTKQQRTRAVKASRNRGWLNT